ncbi:MAG: hypothetical protein ACYCZ0_03525 [Minisyncoccota bacterium]
MKNKSYLALLAIPLAGLGIVSSVAFAQTNTPPVQNTPTAQVEQTTGPDADNIQDQANDSQPDSALEASEAPGMEANDAAEANENLPGGGHQDTDANADHQFEGVE